MNAIVAHWKSFKRKSIIQEEVDINLNDPQVGEAAKKIQNVFRTGVPISFS
ncbi:unnamed protein product [Haemonchus placei]|uniref:HTH_48 domain-containing protein n=1 Tax=Haemonchus placei TaxID=6290 RepID=A0A0N4WF87_HAEPC|nr:unnamed protein product [Haemonchus placei]